MSSNKGRNANHPPLVPKTLCTCGVKSKSRKKAGMALIKSKPLGGSKKSAGVKKIKKTAKAGKSPTKKNRSQLSESGWPRIWVTVGKKKKIARESGPGDAELVRKGRQILTEGSKKIGGKPSAGGIISKKRRRARGKKSKTGGKGHLNARTKKAKNVKARNWGS